MKDKRREEGTMNEDEVRGGEGQVRSRQRERREAVTEMEERTMIDCPTQLQR